MWIARGLRYAQLHGEKGGQQYLTHNFPVICKQSLFHLFTATQWTVVSISRDYEKEETTKPILIIY